MTYVSYEVRNGIAFVTIRTPNDERLVPERHPMHREFRDIFPTLADDPAVSAVVIVGGEDAFIPFPDLDQLDSLLTTHPEMAAGLQREARQIVDNIIDFEKPLVAAVRSDARGMGAQIALLSDFIVAVDSAMFQDTHVRLGLTSGDGATVVWPLVMGLAKARKHILRGHPIGARELHELGIVTDLVTSTDHVLGIATDLAGKLAELPAMAYRSTKLALNQWLRLGSTLTLPLAGSAQVTSYDSPEFLALRQKARDAASRKDPS